MTDGTIALLTANDVIAQGLESGPNVRLRIARQQNRQMIREWQGVNSALRIGTLDEQMATNEIR